jgi:hypothetical protein
MNDHQVAIGWKLWFRRFCLALLLGALLVFFCSPGLAARQSGGPIDTVLFGTVFGDLYDPNFLTSGNASAEVKARVRNFQKRAKAFRSRLPLEKGGPGPERYTHDKKIQLERGMVALIPTPGIAQQARDFALTAPLAYEWEGMSEGPLAEATFAEQYLESHPKTPLAPYLKIFLAHRQRCAFETLTLERKEQAAIRAVEKYRTTLASALADPDPLVRFIAEDIEKRRFLYLKTDNDPLKIVEKPPSASTECPETAISEPIADPWAWSLRCFAVSYGEEAARRGTLNDFAADLDDDGIPELFIGSKVARGNAGSDYYVFKEQGPVYQFMGALFLHPAAFKVIREDGGNQLKMARYRRLGAEEGLFETLVYNGKAFVLIESEKVFPQSKDRARLIKMFSEGLLGAGAEEEKSFKPHCETTITGEVKQGEAFERTFGPSFVFRLEPSSLGWTITVRERGRDEDLSRLTPPFHFVPNPRDLEGWHFRNADNTGPNEAGAKNVNAPGEERELIFSPEVGRSIQGADAKAAPTEDEVAKVRNYGRGLLRIIEYRLNNLEVGQEAGFDWLRFEVSLSYPDETCNRR